MPKKKNFLGGQQNYNPNNGQYEPALKGPNGESPSQFSSFKKEKDESFDATNKKRMGKETESFEESKGSTQYFKHPEVDGVWHDTGKTIEKGGNSYKVYENEQGKTWSVSDRFAKQFQPFDKDKETELLSKDYLDKFYELSGGDEDKMLDLIRKDPAYLNNDNGDPNDTWSMGDLEGIVGAYFERRNNQNKNNSFDQINAKRMGKEQPKNEETQEDKDFNAEIKKTADDIRSSGDRYTYMMLDRLRSDAEYVLGEGKGAMGQLWYNGDPKKHIALMKDLHNGLKDKPEWLSMEKINEYEKKFNDLGPVYVKDNDRKKLTKAGFTLDDTYSGGDTYEIYDKDTGRNNSISLSANGKYYYTTINGTVYYYEDLDTAIDRATYKSGKAPSNGAIGWENDSYDSARAEKKLKELRGY